MASPEGGAEARLGPSHLAGVPKGGGGLLRWLRGQGSWVEIREGFEVSSSLVNRRPSWAQVLPSEFIWGLLLYVLTLALSVKLVQATFVRMLTIRSLWDGNREVLS